MFGFCEDVLRRHDQELIQRCIAGVRGCASVSQALDALEDQQDDLDHSSYDFDRDTWVSKKSIVKETI
jgi:hypothetical protein